MEEVEERRYDNEEVSDDDAMDEERADEDEDEDIDDEEEDEEEDDEEDEEEDEEEEDEEEDEEDRAFVDDGVMEGSGDEDENGDYVPPGEDDDEDDEDDEDDDSNKEDDSGSLLSDVEEEGEEALSDRETASRMGEIDEDAEAIEEGARFTGSASAGGRRVSRAPQRLQDEQNFEVDDEDGPDEPTDEAEHRVELEARRTGPEGGNSRRAKKSRNEIKEQLDQGTVMQLAASVEQSFIQKLKEWDEMGLLRPYEHNRPTRAEAGKDGIAKCIAAQHQIAFLKFDDQRWDKVMAKLERIKEEHGEDAAAQYWIKFGEAEEDENGEPIMRWIPNQHIQVGTENETEVWTSRIFEMMFTGAGKSCVEILTALKMARRRIQLRGVIPDNFDYENGTKAERVNRGRDFMVGKVIFIGPLKTTVQGLFNDLKPGVLKLEASPLFNIFGWPREEVKWINDRTCLYTGLAKADSEAEGKFTRSAIICTTNAMLSAHKGIHCRLLSPTAGVIIWDEGDLGSGIKRSGELQSWMVSSYSKFRDFVDRSPQAAIYYFSSTRNRYLRKMMEYKDTFAKYQKLRHTSFVKQINLRVIMAEPYTETVSSKANRDSMRTVVGETSFWDGRGTHRQMLDSCDALRQAPLWTYAKAIVGMILERRHREKVPWLALIFVPKVGKEGQDIEKYTNLFSLASEEADYDHGFQGNDHARSEQGLPPRGKCSITHKRIEFHYTSAASSDFDDNGLTLKKFKDEEKFDGLLVRSQAGRSYDNPRIGFCIDLTGHGYNAKVQGPIGRGARVWRVRPEDGASAICAKIGADHNLLENEFVCQRVTDTHTGRTGTNTTVTYSYEQKLWLVEMDFNLTIDLARFYQTFAYDQSIDPDGSEEGALQGLGARVVIAGGGEAGGSSDPLITEEDAVGNPGSSTDVGASGADDDGSPTGALLAPAAAGSTSDVSATRMVPQPTLLPLTKLCFFDEEAVVHFDTPFEWKRIPGIEDPAGVRILRLTWPSVQGENVQYDLKAKLPDEEGDIRTVNIIQDSSQNRAILSFPTKGDSGNQQQPSAGPGKAERKNLIKLHELMTDTSTNPKPIKMFVVAHLPKNAEMANSKPFEVSSSCWPEDPDPPNTPVATTNSDRGERIPAPDCAVLVNNVMTFTEDDKKRRLIKLEPEGGSTKDCAPILQHFLKLDVLRTRNQLDPNMPEELRCMLSVTSLCNIALNVLHALFQTGQATAATLDSPSVASRLVPIQRSELLDRMREEEPRLNELVDWHEKGKTLKEDNKPPKKIREWLHSLLGTYIASHTQLNDTRPEEMAKWEVSEYATNKESGEIDRKRLFRNVLYFPPESVTNLDLHEKYTREPRNQLGATIQHRKPRTRVEDDIDDDDMSDVTDRPSRRSGRENRASLVDASKEQVIALAPTCPQEISAHIRNQLEDFKRNPAAYPHVKSNSSVFEHGDWKVRTWRQTRHERPRFMVTVYLPKEGGGVQSRVRTREHWERLMNQNGKRRAAPPRDAPTPQRARTEGPPATLEHALTDSREEQARKEAADLEQARIRSIDDEARRRFALEQ